MQLTRIAIRNYKSLRDIDFAPNQFSVLIGRNSSGKSNFADALEFLAIAYSDGLEHAVARKGGYENIAHRKERRSRSAIGFSVELKVELTDREVLPRQDHSDKRSEALSSWTFRHSFELQATGEGIRSDFKIVSETLDIIKEPLRRKAPDDYEWLNIERRPDGKLDIQGDTSSDLMKTVLLDPILWTGQLRNELALAPIELVFTLPFFRQRVVGRFISWITRLSISQVSPDMSRHAGVPTPNPHMSTRGENLPAVVGWLQSKQPRAWKSIMQAMRDIVPELDDISVSYLHTRTLGLFFHEKGIGRAWTAEEVSDGTIRALAMLVACFDPRTTGLVVEEPENSLHPWIIKEIVGHLRGLSKEKMVMITTHSPVVLNMLSPSEVWIIFKSGGETQIKALVDFDPELLGDWEAGKYRLFDYLESGYVTEAVPASGK